MISLMMDGIEIKERIKSVLIVLLALLLVVRQASLIGREEILSETSADDAVITLKETEAAAAENNPVDIFFQEIKIDYLSAVTKRDFANIYLDCWEKELENGYDMIKIQADAIVSYPDGYIAQSREACLQYAESQGWLEAYYSVGGNEGEAFYCAYIYAKAELIKENTLRIYVLMERDGLDTYIFDEAEVLSELESVKCEKYF